MPEKIEYTCNNYGHGCGQIELERAVAERGVAEEIFGEIEEHCHTFDKDGNPIAHLTFKASNGKVREVNWWQVLKDKYLTNRP